MTADLGPLASRFFQVAYVVRDIAAAEAWWKRVSGISSWFRMNDVRFGADCRLRGAPSDASAHLSIGYLRGTQIELIEPVRGASLYAEFLASKGAGLHHLAFDVPDFDATVRALVDCGLELLADGQVGGPGNRFAYFDCEAGGASVIEILGFDDATRAFMTQIKERSAAGAKLGEPA